ncbi:AAA family ATPase [Sulfitobacter sp. 1A12779]|uniref:AAA family ATPase n=1 Tax=Sulfitobacter sp. 1A12779 TaxID=3368599 RepID=UPI0037476F6F
MITEIEIERFKSIRALKLELGRVNIFIGGNGSGKSNFLEAIGIISAALSRGLSDSDFRRKGVRITPPALMKSAFKYQDLPRTFTLKAKASCDVQYTCTLSSSEIDTALAFSHENFQQAGEKLFARSPNGATAMGSRLKRGMDKYRGIWDQTRSIFDYPEEASEEIEKISKYAIYAPQTEFLRGRRVGSVDTPPIGLHGEGLPIAVKTFLHDLPVPNRSRKKGERNDPEVTLVNRAAHLPFAPGWASSFQVGKLSEFTTSSDMELANEDMVYFVDSFMHAKRNKLSVYDSSEGTLFLLFAAMLIAHKQSPKIFAMDNVDSALNPRLTRLLLDEIIYSTEAKSKYSLSRGPEQVFLTSHNPTSLDAFDIFDDATRIFVVSRSEDGETMIERLQPPSGMSPSEWHEISQGRRLSEMWIDGEIEGALGSDI